MSEMRLKNKVVVVTGGAAGLGRAIGIRCAQEGAQVVLADVNRDGLQNVAAEIESAGGQALTVKVDVREKADVDQMVERAVQTFGKIDVLVNNAGVFSHIPFLELPVEEWDRMMDIHTKGTFLCSQAVLKHMVANKIQGSLIHLSSISGFVAFTGSAHYCAAKGAILQISKVLALEFGPYGIRSNAIAPGTFDTQMNAWFLEDAASRESSLKSIPLNRLGKPEEIASAVVFLASDEASYFNGANLLIDGGQITHI
jgi:NAD(P)-dependent dehydrogenase (short-subunit alcohol dehydrogenase family)